MPEAYASTGILEGGIADVVECAFCRLVSSRMRLEGSRRKRARTSPTRSIRLLVLTALWSRRVRRASQPGDCGPSTGEAGPGRGCCSHTDGVRAAVGGSPPRALNGVGRDCAFS